MGGRPDHDVTALLMAWRQGDEEALGHLTPLVYDELHRLAERYMRGERAGHSLQTTALVNEAYIKLVDSSRVRWQNRVHFFAVAAQLMRRILVDFARRRRYQKRGGDWQKVTLAEGFDVATNVNNDLVAVDRGAARARHARSPQSASGRTSFFRRSQPRGDGRSLECFNRHGGAGLESSEGLADP